MSAPAPPVTAGLDLRSSSFRHDPERVAERASELLGDSPFTEHADGVLEQAIQRVSDVLGELVVRLFTAAGGGTTMAWTVVVVAAVLLVAVVWRVTRGASLSVSSRAVQPPGDRTPRTDHDAHARRATEAGDLEAALRAHFSALVAELRERGLVHSPESRTVRELAGGLQARSGELAASVADLGARVEEVVFGGRAAARQDIDVALRTRRQLARST